jgi:hypothetical protein
MPILFVVKRSRPRLYRALKRLVERKGLVAVVLERRQRKRRRRRQPIAFDDRRMVSLRQPLDSDGNRMWSRLGFVIMKVRVLPSDAPRSAPLRGR